MKTAPNIDFAISPGARKFRAIRVWLVLGFLLTCQLCWNVWRYQSYSAQKEVLTQAIESSTKEVHSKTKNLNARQTELMKTMEIILGQLSVPWEEMLLAIESSRLPTLTVESLQPRPAQSTVTMTVNATDFQSISEFVTALRHKSVFQDVQVLSESVSDNGPLSWSAVIDMKWGVAK